MLPFGVGQRSERVFDPIVSGLFPARAAKPRFTCMGTFGGFATFSALEKTPAEKRSAASKHFQDINDDTEPNESAILDEKFPPIPIIQKDITEFDAGDNFHND